MFRTTRTRPVSSRRRNRARFCFGWQQFEDRMLLSTFTVTNTLDNGDDHNPVPGSLRAAIVAANADAESAGATIVFNMDPSDPNHFYYQNDLNHIANTTVADDSLLTDAAPQHPQSWWSITVGGLPVITNKVLINGYSQAGASANTLTEGDDAVLRIELDGVGLRIGDDCSVQGLVINRVSIVGNGGYGLEIGGNREVVTGNFIGTDVSGTLALGNDVGIKFFGTACVIGGTTPAARNVISGNRLAGISNYGSAHQNTIQGNFIGTDATGTRALGNATGIESPSSDLIGGTASGAGNVISGNGTGIAGGGGSQIKGNYIGTDATGTHAVGNHNGIAGASGTTIGGSEPGAGNVISGNGNGIGFMSGGHIEGNLIGTDWTGTAAVGNDYGFYLEVSSNNTIGGTTAGARNIISGNYNGIYIFSFQANVPATGNVIEGNFIGTDITGTHVLGNGQFASGILLGPNTSGNTIGGTTPEARNIISGNAGDGITLGNSGGAATGNLIEGNYVGTDVTGTTTTDPGPDGTFNTGDDQPLGNNIGIDVIEGSNNTIGGTAPGAGNVIAGAGFAGIWLGTTSGAYTIVTGNQIQGNLIGTDKTGTQALGNARGVFLQEGVTPTVSGVHDNLIGGTTAAARNVISGNQGFGVGIGQGSGNLVQGNFIGTDISGTLPLGNGGGVFFKYESYDNTIGGTEAGAANIIAYSKTYGGVVLDPINIYGGPSSGNTFRGNSIHDNAGLGIDLGADGVTRNDSHPGATDGPNNWQNFPVLSSVIGGDVTHVVGMLHSAPNTAYTIDVYASPAPDPSGYGEGQRYLGWVCVTTNGNGDATFDARNLAASATGEYVSATATGAAGTSEFSADLVVPPPSSLSGIVFVDFNDDGQVDFGEKGIAGVPITLAGTDDLGRSVNLSQNTNASGVYVFLNLRPGNYQITESQEPVGFTQGMNTVGTGGGSVAGDEFSVGLPVSVDAMNYNFGERPAATGPIQSGQTANIGFWNNKNGQALIKALNGGIGTQLGDWLATTFPHMFGALSKSNNLAGKNNAYVASFFQSKFVVQGLKLDAHVLASALSVYVTNATLDNTGVATHYGFTVSGYGVGTANVNVGSNGSAFGVANNTVMTVMDLLLAADAQAVNGLLYNGNTTKRNQANNVFSAINQAGGI